MSSLYILDKSSSPNLCFINISSQFVGCVFIFVVMPLAKQKFLVLLKSGLSIFKIFAQPNNPNCLPFLTLENLWVKLLHLSL